MDRFLLLDQQGNMLIHREEWKKPIFQASLMAKLIVITVETQKALENTVS